jgi:hypothetical protein
VCFGKIKEIIFILIIVFFNTMFFFKTANAGQVRSNFNCLDNCLESIPGSRRIFDIVIYDLHQQIESKLLRLGIKLEDGNLNQTIHDKIVEFMDKKNELLELAEIQQFVSETYIKLYRECLNSDPSNKNHNIGRANRGDSYLDGSIPFSLIEIFKNPEYKFRIIDSIARGFGVGLNDIEYDVSTMNFTIRVGEKGEVLPSLNYSSKIIEKMNLKKRVGLKLSGKESRLNKHAGNSASYLYVGSINIFSFSNDCLSYRRSDQAEEYCNHGVMTQIKKIDVETSEIINITDRSTKISALMLAGSIKENRRDDRISLNLKQLDNSLKFLTYSVCRNQNELFGGDHTSSGLQFMMPCEKSLIFSVPVKK